jgi:hypothetical protein
MFAKRASLSLMRSLRRALCAGHVDKSMESVSQLRHRIIMIAAFVL